MSTDPRQTDSTAETTAAAPDPDAPFAVVYTMYSDREPQKKIFEISSESLFMLHYDYPERAQAMKAALHLAAELGLSLRQCDAALNLAATTTKTWTRRYPTDFGILMETAQAQGKARQQARQQRILDLYY